LGAFPLSKEKPKLEPSADSKKEENKVVKKKIKKNKGSREF